LAAADAGVVEVVEVAAGAAEAAVVALTAPEAVNPEAAGRAGTGDLLDLSRSDFGKGLQGRQRR
jgi:hypothetical protein